MAISFVAGATGGLLASDTNKDISLPSGTTTDDIVIVLTTADGAYTSPDGKANTTGYTQLAYNTGANPSNWIGYKVMGATPDTVVNIEGNGPGGSGISVTIQTFRGINTSSPIGVTLVESSGATLDPNPASITLAVDQMSVIFGSLDDDVNSDITAPTDWSNLTFHNHGSAGAGCTSMMASRLISSAGAYDPAAFGGGGDDEWRAGHLGLAPVTNPVITAAGGSYSITGAAASLEVGRLVAAAGGSYAISGTAASLEVGKIVAANGGSYSISGAEASLEVGYLVAANGGSYLISGAAATLTKTIPIAANGGSYSISGGAASLLEGSLIAAAGGSYSISGAAASLEVGRVVAADGGSYAISGAAANFIKGFGLVADSGVYSISGGAANLLQAHKLIANGGSYAITGGDANLVFTPAGGAGAGELVPIFRRRRR